MKLKLVVLMLLVATVAIVIEASVVVNTSVRTRRGIFDECVSCYADDRPFYYPLVKYFNKMKNAVVKGFSEITASAKEYSKKLA